MANKKISQLTAKGTALAATDLIEISESDGAGGYVTKSVTGANVKSGLQPTLVSATNIKTINSTTLLGSGDLAVQPTLVSGTDIKTINSNSILGSGDLAVQATLVSATNIKTINSNSILGSGDLVVGGTEIGAQIGGGIVIAVFNDAGVNKALVASLTNLSTGLQWTIPAFQSTSCATAQSFYDGLTNTDAIIAQTLLPANTTYAAGIARLYAGGGFSDWYLPSVWELYMLYNSAAIVNKILGANGFALFNYWSSTEFSPVNSYTRSFAGATQSSFNKSASAIYVRAVRIHTI